MHPLARFTRNSTLKFAGWFFGAFILTCAQYSQAESLQLESSSKQTGLLELYTSEGCSSCPPADRWVSSLLEKEGLWQEFIPIALHVDYWDYIGWQDRFASPVYSNRQRQYAREHSVKTVYTPGFLYNGKEWRKWFARRLLDFPEGEDTGVLSLEIKDQQVNIDFKPSIDKQTQLTGHVALLGFDIKTQVRAGENEGKTLTHNFVVLGMENKSMEQNARGFQTELQLPDAKISSPRYAVVAWVSTADRQRPLQSVGGWLKD